MRVAVVFINVGDYHAARLMSADRAFRSLGWELEGVQVTSDTLEHPWGDPTDAFQGRFRFSTLMNHDLSKPPQLDRPYSREAGRLMYDYLERSRPDAVLAPGWSFSVAVSALRWCRKRSKVAVLASESNQFDAPRSWWKEAVKGFRVRRFSSALVGGRSHADYLEQLGFNPKRIAFGYDVVDNAAFDPKLIGSLPRPVERPYFLTVGRFVAKKNLLSVVAAYDHYRKSVDTPWALVLCGDGPLRCKIVEAIESRGLGEHIKLRVSCGNVNCSLITRTPIVLFTRASKNNGVWS